MMRRIFLAAAAALLMASPSAALNSAELDRLIHNSVNSGGTAAQPTMVQPSVPATSAIPTASESPLETRVAKIVRTEMGPKWPSEALKAQAVLARTFTLYASGAALSSAESGQTAAGSVGGDAVSTAVAETAGEVVAYNGAIAQVFYCSDSGGISASSQSVWGKALPYLIPRTDPISCNSPVSRWQISISAEDLSQKLSAAGFGVGIVLGVSVNTRDDSGRVQQMTITGTEGTKTISGAKFRAAVGSASVKSTLFEIAGDASAPRQPSAPAVTAVQAPAPVQKSYPSPDRSTMPSAPEDKLVWMAKNRVFTTQELMSMIGREKEYPRFIAEGEARMSGKKRPNPQQSIQTQPAQQTYTQQRPSQPQSGVITITGRGYGHGVGMPQWCAKALAEAGWSYRQIIEYYFPGTTIEKGIY